MSKKTIKKIEDVKIPNAVKKEIKVEDISFTAKSKWIKSQFKKIVTIIKMTDKGLTEVEMVDAEGNVIVWNGRNFDTNKIKLNNKLEIVGRPKEFVEIHGVKKTIIKYMTC